MKKRMDIGDVTKYMLKFTDDNIKFIVNTIPQEARTWSDQKLRNAIEYYNQGDCCCIIFNIHKNVSEEDSATYIETRIWEKQELEEKSLS